MFVNISPLVDNVDESLSSLQYASRVKKVSNKSTKQIETKEIRRLKKQLAKLNKWEVIGVLCVCEFLEYFLNMIKCALRLNMCDAY